MSDANGNEKGTWIYAMLYGARDDAGAVEVGLWWDPPKLGIPLIVYANRWYPSASKSRFGKTPSNPRVQMGRVDGRDRIYIVPGDDLDLDAISNCC